MDLFLHYSLSTWLVSDGLEDLKRAVYGVQQASPKGRCYNPEVSFTEIDSKVIYEALVDGLWPFIIDVGFDYWVANTMQKLLEFCPCNTSLSCE